MIILEITIWKTHHGNDRIYSALGALYILSFPWGVFDMVITGITMMNLQQDTVFNHN